MNYNYTTASATLCGSTLNLAIGYWMAESEDDACEQARKEAEEKRPHETFVGVIATPLPNVKDEPLRSGEKGKL